MKPGKIRIIAGEWRGRRLQVPDVENLRPTPDRVRETLFNWLAPMITGARCLDLFAGTGVLGIEALSRGASEVVMVDQSAEAINLIDANLSHFGAKNGNAYRAKIPQELRPSAHPFDIVFIDPPYQSDLLQSCCQYLEEKSFLADGAHIYLEAREAINNNDLPSGWRIVKNKKAGQVAYHLVQRELKTDD